MSARLVSRYCFLLLVFLQAIVSAHGATPPLKDDQLSARIESFTLANASFLDALSELSSQSGSESHFGVEEVLQDRVSMQPEPLFSLKLKDKSVREILNALCKLDPRYSWFRTGSSINIVPRLVKADSSYFLNRRIDQVILREITNPDEVFTPLHKKFPKEPMIYMQSGGDISYLKPWTATFRNITVRELINKVAEHIGPRTVWLMYGSKRAPVFTFERGGFRLIKTQPYNSQ